MTIQRASKIVLALHYRLIEEGFTAEQSQNIISTMTHSGLLAHLMHEKKDGIIAVLVQDLRVAFKDLRTSHQILVGHDERSEYERENEDLLDESEPPPRENKDWQEQQIQECMWLLVTALHAHYAPEETIGY